MLKSSKEKGFTIIEVVLVLAIAGLIFLVVLLALPALQRNQRDTARRQDVGKVVSALQSYMTDNKNVLPTTTASFTSGYWTGLAQATGLTVSAVSVTPTQDGITIQQGAVCPGSTSTDSARHAAVRILLENGGTYCQEV